jgi:hypothetical protein
MSNKYSNGKIYAIMSPHTDKMYIGSTIDTLHNRFRKHKTKKNCSSIEVLHHLDCYIQLIQMFPCNSKQELNRQEGKYILNNDCVNKRVAGRTKKEYDEQNKDIKKQYYQKNKEKKKKEIKKYNDNHKEERNQKAKIYRLKKKALLNNQSSFDNPVLL